MTRLTQDVSDAFDARQTLVVPSRQRSEALRLARAADGLRRGEQVWQTPDVLPLEAWKAREIDRRATSGEPLPRILTAAEEWLLWRQGVAELTDTLDLVARAPLADALIRASQIAADFRIDISRLRNAPGSEGRLLYEVHRAVSARTRELNASTAADLAIRLGDLGSEQPLLVAGFTQITPGIRALIDARETAGRETRVRTLPNTGNGEIRASFAADPADELERIAAWCEHRLQRQPDARLLVMVPGSPEARERLVTLIRQSLDPSSALSPAPERGSVDRLAALEGGMPLSRAPLVAHALSTLAWLSGGSEYSDFSAWLCSPFWAIPSAVRARLDLWLRERCGLEVEPRALLAALQAVPESLARGAGELTVQVADAVTQLTAGRSSPRQWSERFDAALQSLRWPGDRPLDSDEEQTRVRFTQLLDDFGQLAHAAGAIPRETAVQWLSELASRTSFRPATADALVTVSGQLEDPIVRYDGIWVAGLHADAWPPPVQPDPFLLLDSQVKAGVLAATSAGRAAEARELTKAWANATCELVLSTPLRADDVQLSPSPLLAAYPVTRASEESSTSIWLPARIRRAGLTELVEDFSGTPWDITHRLPSGTRSVELQNLCPFRAYSELRLGSSVLDAPEPGVAADLRGKLLHAALERLWSVLKGSDGLRAYPGESLDTLIENAVEEAAVRTLGPVPANGRSAADRRECRRALRLIRALCQLERRRAPFTVRDIELDRTMQLGGAELRVRIDRLDALASGGLAILDYKSGRPAQGDWYSERPSHPQLLAYLAAVGEETVAMATVNVTAREIRFDGIAADGNLLPKVRGVDPPPPGGNQEAWPYWQQQWRSRVEKLASDFIAGHAAVDPRPKACQYCHVVSVCRISDASATAVEQNIDD